jgi:hypothetical protein
MGARLLALVEHGHRDLAEAFGQLRRILEQLAEPDRAGEPRRPGADDQDTDLDLRLTRSGDELARRERRREI